jgi:phosphopantothenoylcysteine decarboxylase/phosphopantothenate--cysteine ligase
MQSKGAVDEIMGKKALRRKRIVLGVTGSIACYKAALLARQLVKRGYAVRVVMTSSAQRFITPLTFSSLTGNPVNTDLWSEGEPGSIGHIELADWGELLLVAPASADFIAKFACGAADSNLLAIALATKAPIAIAPAMNVNMYENPVTQHNLAKLKERGITVIEPDNGSLACGWIGKGRLAKISEIALQCERALTVKDLIGKRVVVSAGPTREMIDPVRFISNRSSGRMGFAIARQAYLRGADVTLVHGPVSLSTPLPQGIKRIPVTSALEMQRAINGAVFSESGVSQCDYVIMAAAVADFRPSSFVAEKIKRAKAIPDINLVQNPDIIAELSRIRGAAKTPLLVAFAVETASSDEELLVEVRSKLIRKGADVVIGNLASEAFDGALNRVWIAVKDSDEVLALPTASKGAIARGIWDRLALSR